MTVIPLEFKHLRVGDGLGSERYVGITMLGGTEGACLSFEDAVQLCTWLRDWIDQQDPAHWHGWGK